MLNFWFAYKYIHVIKIPFNGTHYVLIPTLCLLWRQNIYTNSNFQGTYTYGYPTLPSQFCLSSVLLRPQAVHLYVTVLSFCL